MDFFYAMTDIRVFAYLRSGVVDNKRQVGNDTVPRNLDPKDFRDK